MHAMQVLVPKMPVVVAPAPMDVEGVFQDGLRKFKKEFEEVSCEYFAGMARVGLNLLDSFNAPRAGGVGPQQVDMAVRINFFEGMKKLYDNAQRKMMKAFEDDQRVFALFKPEAAAPFLNPPASTAKPAGESVNGVGEARVSSETKVNASVGYAPIFVGRLPRAMADAELQEVFCFGPRPSVCLVIGVQLYIMCVQQ